MMGYVPAVWVYARHQGKVLVMRCALPTPQADAIFAPSVLGRTWGASSTAIVWN
jgi:hypothetical protein